MGWDAGSHMGVMGFWWIFGLLTLVTVAWVAVLAGRGHGPRDLSAEQRLKQRYAAGEIDRATYEQVLTELRK